MSENNRNEIVDKIITKYSNEHFNDSSSDDKKYFNIAADCFELFEKNNLANMEIDQIIKYIRYIQSKAYPKLFSIIGK